VKKKHAATSKDKLDWVNFTKKLQSVYDKEKGIDFVNCKNKIKKIGKVDLHGKSVNEANQITKKFVIQSFEQGYEKILIVTGKGLRSKVYNDPYRAKDMNVLKYSVPEYIRNNEELSNKIIKISKADLKNGGEGAICIYLKRSKKVIE